MTSPFQKLAQKEYSQNPESGKKNPYKSPFEQLSSSPKYAEGTSKSFLRTVAQVPQGLLEATTPGIAAGLWQLLSQGEILDPEEIEQIKKISERSGIPFDEEKYFEAAQQALGTVPTVSNISSAIEKRTGIPLEPKTRLQKGVRLGSMAAGFTPGTLGQKAVAGITAPATATGLEAAGVPEPFAELAGLGVAGLAGSKAPEIDIGKAKKPSGLTERGFESVKTPREVSESKIGKINQALESDFKDLSEKIIKESPIGETAENLKNDPSYKQASRDLLDEAQTVANSIDTPISSKSLKKELADISSKRPKGFALDEYDKSYLRFMKQSIEDILPENITHGELVEQYRKNNRALTEYFEPGSSKALNRAKRDAILDQNRAIANVLEKTSPELSKVFKEGNSRWTKIMDVEAVDEFIGEIFKEGINYKKLHEWFDKTGYDRIFKRALGEEGYKSFETLMKDMLSSEAPYKMLKVAKDKGLEDYAKLAKGYIFKPVVGQTKFVIDTAKGTYKALMNSMLEKPKLAFTWKKAVEDLKKGDFKASEQGFKSVDAEVQSGPMKTKGKSPIREQTIEVTPEEIKSEYKQIEFKEPISEKTEPKKIEEPKKQIEFKEPKKLAEPKLIEYSPKPMEKQTVKDRMNNLAKESFNEVLEGKEISKSEKDLLKNTEVSLLETRGKGQQFHGTKQPISKLNNDIYSKSSEQNIYGAGFYTTDALDIADGYSKAKSAKNPTVYQVKEVIPQKIYDAEQPINEFKNWWIEKEKKYFESMQEKSQLSKDPYFKKYTGTFENYLKNSDYLPHEILYDEKPKSVRDFYDKIRERAIDENLIAYEVQEYFDFIQNILEEMGYEGISHKGGLLTNNPEHSVKIYWKPENLEIQEFAYPKEFKKVKQIAKPIEFPSTQKKTEIKLKEIETPKQKIIKELKKPTESSGSKEAERKDFIREELEKFSRDEIREIYKEAFPEITDKALNLITSKFKEKPETKLKKNAKKIVEEKKVEKPHLTEKEIQSVKHQDISKKGLKEQKQHLLDKLDEAIKKAPEGYEEFGEKIGKSESLKKYKSKIKERAEKYELLTFDVPGDGQFKIKNHKKALQAFRNSVEKRWPDKPLKKSGVLDALPKSYLRKS